MLGTPALKSEGILWKITMKKKKTRIGLLSKFYPEFDTIGKIYCKYLLDIAKEKKDIEFITIGSQESYSRYRINMKSLFLAKEIKRIIKKEKIDLLHIQYIAPFYSKKLLNINLWQVYNLKVPIITTMHEVQYPDKGGIYGLKEKILGLTEGVIIKKSKKVTVHAPYQKKFLENKYHAHNIENIYTGIDPKKKPKRRGKNIIFFGMFSKNKGIDKLILAMKKLNDFSLTIGGSIPDNYAKNCFRQFKGLIKEKNLKNVKIIAKPWVSDKEKCELFYKSDIVVIPYDWGPYNSGLVQDAAEYFLPHAVNKVGAIWEVTDKFKMGEVMRNNSPGEIVKTVLKIDKNYEKYKKGLKKYRNVTRWQNLKKQYYKIYKEVVS